MASILCRVWTPDIRQELGNMETFGALSGLQLTSTEGDMHFPLYFIE